MRDAEDYGNAQSWLEEGSAAVGGRNIATKKENMKININRLFRFFIFSKFLSGRCFPPGSRNTLVNVS